MRSFFSIQKRGKTKWLSAGGTIAFVLLIFFIDTVFPTPNPMQLSKQKWLEDLHEAVKTLTENHPNLYYRISRDEFQKNVAKAERVISQSHSDEECFVAIRQLIASVKDGHTRLGTEMLPDWQRIFPVRIYDFTDGIFITGIEEKFSRYIGAQVLKIGRFPATEALQKAGELAFADNDFGRKCQAPLLAMNCKYAFGLGITESVEQLLLEVETVQGKHETILIAPVPAMEQYKILSAMDIGPERMDFKSAFTGTGKELPLYLKHLDGKHNYWFEHDMENRILYMQFNTVVDQQNESFEQFYQKMFGYYDEYAGSIDKFILDLRFNGGGNGMMVIPFINEIIKRDKLNQTGCFFTLTGRHSFSAAVLFIAELLVHTRTLLVGEPTGAAQNMFSDMQEKGTLPNCGASLLLSTEFFNLAWPAGKNQTIPPHYPSPFSSSDFFSGNDPAYEAIKTSNVKALQTVFDKEGAVAALNYYNKIEYNWGLHSDELCILPGTFPVAKYNFSENELNNLGYDYMKKGKIKEAQATFYLNTVMFPDSFNVWDSLAEWYMNNGDYSNAVKNYKKSLRINPHNANARDKIRELSSHFHDIWGFTSIYSGNYDLAAFGSNYIQLR